MLVSQDFVGFPPALLDQAQLGLQQSQYLVAKPLALKMYATKARNMITFMFIY
jgi:hypothetical protein